jgi:hypothetical protein
MPDRPPTPPAELLGLLERIQPDAAPDPDVLPDGATPPADPAEGASAP